jgi:hypothetical protein
LEGHGAERIGKERLGSFEGTGEDGLGPDNYMNPVTEHTIRPAVEKKWWQK